MLTEFAPRYIYMYVCMCVCIYVCVCVCVCVCVERERERESWKNTYRELERTRHIEFCNLEHSHQHSQML